MNIPSPRALSWVAGEAQRLIESLDVLLAQTERPSELSTQLQLARFHAGKAAAWLDHFITSAKFGPPLKFRFVEGRARLSDGESR